MDDLADLEPLAARLEQSGEYRVLRRVPVVTRREAAAPAAQPGTLRHRGESKDG